MEDWREVFQAEHAILRAVRARGIEIPNGDIAHHRRGVRRQRRDGHLPGIARALLGGAAGDLRGDLVIGGRGDATHHHAVLHDVRHLEGHGRARFGGAAARTPAVHFVQIIVRVGTQVLGDGLHRGEGGTLLRLVHVADAVINGVIRLNIEHGNQVDLEALAVVVLHLQHRGLPPVELAVAVHRGHERPVVAVHRLQPGHEVVVEVGRRICDAILAAIHRHQHIGHVVLGQVEVQAVALLEFKAAVKVDQRGEPRLRTGDDADAIHVFHGRHLRRRAKRRQCQQRDNQAKDDFPHWVSLLWSYV